MQNIFLIIMPFGNLNDTSLGLTQLKSVIESKYKSFFSTKIFYFNQDFSHYFWGVATYKQVQPMDSLASGIGEWFFRQSAFPEQPDNSEKYFNRFYANMDVRTEMLKRFLLEKRRGLDDFLDTLIEKYNIQDAKIAGFKHSFHRL